MWNKLEKLLLVLTCAVLAFTVGLIVGINNNSKIVEKLANENIVKERTIQQQKERIRELQEFKQLKEIYNA
ncbi:hypothetical protein [Gemella sp.]